MSRYVPLQRLNSDDFRESSQWFRSFLESYNILTDSLNGLLEGNIDIPNNLRADQRQVTVTHNVPINIRTRISSPSFVMVGYAAGYIATAGITSYAADGSVNVVVFFVGTVPTAPVQVNLWFM